MNPRPKLDWLEQIYRKSGHGLTEPVSLKQVLSNESQCPNSTIDAERLIGNAVGLLPQGKMLKALDIGSGYGFYSAAALRHGLEVTALNPGKWENDVFEAMNNFRPIETLFEQSSLYGKKEIFDVVIMSQVLEHIHEPLEFLKQVCKLMKKGGIIAFAVPNMASIRVKLLGVNDNSCFWCPEHLNYFTLNGLFKMFERADLTIVKHCNISRIPYFSISNRLNLEGFFRSVTNSVVKYSQVLPLSICNRLGIGFYLNVYARK